MPAILERQLYRFGINRADRVVGYAVTQIFAHIQRLYMRHVGDDDPTAITIAANDLLVSTRTQPWLGITAIVVFSSPDLSGCSSVS